MLEPILIKSGDPRVRLGLNMQPPKVDCRVLAEETYQQLQSQLSEARKENEELRNNYKSLDHQYRVVKSQLESLIQQTKR